MSCQAWTVRATGSLCALPPAGIVTDGKPPNVTGRVDPAATNAPCTRCPTDALPMVTVSGPNVLSRRMRMNWPGIVTRANSRTVALLTVAGVTFGCCEVPHAVTQSQRPPCSSATAGAHKSTIEKQANARIAAVSFLTDMISPFDAIPSLQEDEIKASCVLPQADSAA